MVRLTFLLRRRAGLDLDEFQSYWRQEHGPLMASFSTDLQVLRYVQVHTIAGEDHSRLWGPRGEMEEPYDGVAEAWFESRDALLAALGSKAGQAAGGALLDDERTFVDLARSPIWANYEYPQVNPTPENLVATERSTVVKLYFPLRRRPDLSLDDAQRYWRTHHGPVIRRQAHGAGILRYQQVHAAEPEITETLRAARGTEVESYAGHAEVWFDRAQGGGTPERRVAARRAYEDESNFIDFTRSSMWLGKEHVFVDKR
ncbi:MAG: EthD domain-containing protein [Actinomycetia bacterium]|nr:EthD domain-containing protein [Actinomycetes bacterium]